MRKNIKFPLKMKDDFPVRTMEELREHFDLTKMNELSLEHEGNIYTLKKLAEENNVPVHVLE